MDKENGRMPTGKNINEYSVDFCHGSPGLIPLLTLAAGVFPTEKQKYWSVVEKAGELTWKEGLLRKGNGLCHGIAGNGYIMHNLNRSW